MVEPLSGGMKRRLTIARALINEPEHAPARRADHRPRPAGPARAVGPAVPAQAAGRHARPDHALHGRGRAAVRPAGRHGRRPDRRRGLAPRADRRATPPARCSSCGSTSTSTTTPLAQRLDGIWRPGRGAARPPPRSTPTTATPPLAAVTGAGLRPLSVAGPPQHAWRTSSSASPAGPWSTDDRRRRRDSRLRRSTGSPVRALRSTSTSCAVYRRTWRGSLTTRS